MAKRAPLQHLGSRTLRHAPRSPFQKIIDAVGLEKVSDTVASVLEADRKPDGELRQDNTFRFVIVIKPEAAA